jgi:2-(1,2-epoxy-1,2-dihydrophenyl)acetyl-CoA isomerase
MADFFWFCRLRRAQVMILTNQRVVAEEAAQLGLITQVAEDDNFVSAGDAFAACFVEAPTAALGATRGLLLASATLPLDIHLNREAATIAAAGGHAESREGGDTSVFGSSPSSDRRVKGGC